MAASALLFMNLYVDNFTGQDAWVTRVNGPTTLWWKMVPGANVLDRGLDAYVFSFVAVHPATGALVTNSPSLAGNTNVDVRWRCQWLTSASATNLNLSSTVWPAARNAWYLQQVEVVALVFIIGQLAALAWFFNRRK